ncbi:hypothetical protein GYMLUDRAFT_908019 [Collybiopsis luxurians FD-317 M1]|nr:hypothetical protein GYMLUDRAFT_908019 [Collybiopsis luxurians FD-317 M1]
MCRSDSPSIILCSLVPPQRKTPPSNPYLMPIYRSQTFIYLCFNCIVSLCEGFASVAVLFQIRFLLL